jgi:hypothetical protein
MAVGDTFVMDEQDGKTVNRIDKKDTWEAVNPVLGVGEIGIEKDGMLKNIKIGDGQTAWNALGYTFKQCPYEVGDIYMTTSSVTPATRWPGTQWEVFAPGRVLIGAGTGQDSRGESKTFEIGDTGGEYQHQLTTGELPSHRHEFSRPQWFNPNIDSSPVGTSSQTIYGYTSGTTRQYADVTYYVGSDNVHNNQQPFVTVLYYRRIS